MSYHLSSDRNSEEGVYTITAAGGDRLVLPIEIVGKKADIQVSYKGIDARGIGGIWSDDQIDGGGEYSG